MAKREVEDIKDVSKQIIREEPVEFINTGSTMVNLAASGKGRSGGWARGRVINIVGDGSSGKTALALETFAQAYYHLRETKSKIFPPVKNLILKYNNVERVMDFPLATMYKQKFVDAVDWRTTREIEQFGRDFARSCLKLKDGDCLIYALDSLDSLIAHDSKVRFEDAAEEDREEDTSYGTEKPKYASKFFSHICGLMDGKDATLIIISQVRQIINPMTFGKKIYRTGGKALDFYTHQVAWLAEVEKTARVFRGEKRPYGIRSKAKFERNKTAKPFREAEFRILFDYGVDDLGSMIDWYWGPKKEKLDFDGEKFTRAELIDYVEENDLIDVVQDMCEKEWQEIEKEIAPKRKPRFE